MLKKANVLIPMAGLGSRFAQAGYDKPKPLIDIFGKTMIERAIESLDIEGDYIFVIRKDKNAEKLKSVLFKTKPNCRIIEITGSTEGAACTCLIAKSLINNTSPLIIANCDQIMEYGIMLPCHPTMTDEDCAYVEQTLKDFIDSDGNP